MTDTVGFTNWVDACFGFGLLLAGWYAFLVLLGGFFQTAWPLQRLGPCHAAGRGQLAQRGRVHPTYNEPLEVVKRLVFSAVAKMDWPKTGCTCAIATAVAEEFRDFCEDARRGLPDARQQRPRQSGQHQRRWP